MGADGADHRDGQIRGSGRPPHSTGNSLFALAQASFLLAEPLFPEYSRRRTESLEHIQRVPDRIHEPFFERGHEDAIRDSVGGIGGGFTIRDHLKLLRDRAGFEEKFAGPLKEKDGAIGGVGHRFAQAPSMSPSICFNNRIVSVRACHVPVQLTPR